MTDHIDDVDNDIIMVNHVIIKKGIKRIRTNGQCNRTDQLPG